MSARKLVMGSKKSLGYWIANRQIAPPTLTYCMQSACRQFFTIPPPSTSPVSPNTASTATVSATRHSKAASSDTKNVSSVTTNNNASGSQPAKRSDSYYSRARSVIHRGPAVSNQSRPKPSGRVRGFSTGLDEDHPTVVWWQDNNDQEILVLDVRVPEELTYAGNVPGAVNIPLHEIPERFDELGDRQRPIGVFCMAGVRSQQAIDFLRTKGFANLGNTISVSFQKALLEEFPMEK